MTEKRSTTEKQHEIRYHVQYVYIPEIVKSVNDGYLPYIALFPSMGRGFMISGDILNKRRSLRLWCMKVSKRWRWVRITS